MGNGACFGRHARRPERLGRDDDQNYPYASALDSNYQKVYVASSYADCMKLRCLRTNKPGDNKATLSQAHHVLQDGQQQQKLRQVLLKKDGEELITTLEDVLIHSPIKQLPPNKVYPSLAEVYSSPDGDNSYYRGRGSFSLERLLKVGEADSANVEYNNSIASSARSSVSRSQKRVSFKLPEEADIFLYNPSEDEEGE